VKQVTVPSLGAGSNEIPVTNRDEQQAMAPGRFVVTAP
jgi:hypothetical protein